MTRQSAQMVNSGPWVRFVQTRTLNCELQFELEPSAVDIRTKQSIECKGQSVRPYHVVQLLFALSISLKATGVIMYIYTILINLQPSRKKNIYFIFFGNIYFYVAIGFKLNLGVFLFANRIGLNKRNCKKGLSTEIHS